ncbi:unnamed protein product [Absidia cylindrospora]
MVAELATFFDATSSSTECYYSKNYLSYILQEICEDGLVKYLEFYKSDRRLGYIPLISGFINWEKRFGHSEEFDEIGVLDNMNNAAKAHNHQQVYWELQQQPIVSAHCTRNCSNGQTDSSTKPRKSIMSLS